VLNNSLSRSILQITSTLALAFLQSCATATAAAAIATIRQAHYQRA